MQHCKVGSGLEKANFLCQRPLETIEIKEYNSSMNLLTTIYVTPPLASFQTSSQLFSVVYTEKLVPETTCGTSYVVRYIIVLSK